MSLSPLFDKLRLPVIGSPLFIISNPKLVIGVGTYAAKSPAAANQLCPLGTRTQGGL